MFPLIDVSTYCRHKHCEYLHSALVYVPDGPNPFNDLPCLRQTQDSVILLLCFHSILCNPYNALAYVAAALGCQILAVKRRQVFLMHDTFFFSSLWTALNSFCPLPLSYHPSLMLDIGAYLRRTTILECFNLKKHYILFKYEVIL